MEYRLRNKITGEPLPGLPAIRESEPEPEPIKPAIKPKPKPVKPTLCEPKLTLEQAREIRRLYQTGKSGKRVLALQFGISRAVVHAVLRGDAWKETSEQT